MLYRIYETQHFHIIMQKKRVCIEVDMKGTVQGKVSATLTEGNWRFIKGRIRLASVGSDKD